MTDTRLEQQRTAALQHGLRSAFAKDSADETMLQPAQRSRLAELRESLATPDGVQAALIERAARMVLIAEWGEEWLREKAEKEGAVAAFTAPMLARLFTASAEARRALETLFKVNGKDNGLTAADVLEAVKNAKD
jgi:hypothetical protein